MPRAYRLHRPLLPRSIFDDKRILLLMMATLFWRHQYPVTNEK